MITVPGDDDDEGKDDDDNPKKYTANCIQVIIPMLIFSRLPRGPGKVLTLKQEKHNQRIKGNFAAKQKPETT